MAARSTPTNPPVLARPAAGIFFPLRPSLHLDAHGFSPAILGKIVRSAARSTSFAVAAGSLADEAEVQISGRQLERIAHEFGEQLQSDRDRRVEEFLDKTATPDVPVIPRLAVVLIDGGRLQTRTEGSGRGPAAHDPAWREDKVANFMTMSTKSHDHDPHPELPRCFAQRHAVVELVQGIAGQGALADVVEASGEGPPALTVFEPVEDGSKPRWQPEPLVRTCQATRGSSEQFGPMVAAEAHRRNFFAAQARAFLGDGGSWIWTLQRTYFSTFVPIVDFVHVLTHIYLAAKAVGGPASAVWERYLGWATACWQGRVAAVLEELRAVLGDDDASTRGPRGQADRPVRDHPPDDRLSGEQPGPDGLSAIPSGRITDRLGLGGVADQAVQPPGQRDGEVLESDERRDDPSPSRRLPQRRRAVDQAHEESRDQTVSPISSCEAKESWVRGYPVIISWFFLYLKGADGLDSSGCKRLSMRWIELILMIASLELRVQLVVRDCSAGHRPIQANVRSTTQRLGSFT